MRGKCNFHCVNGLKRKREFSLKKEKKRKREQNVVVGVFHLRPSILFFIFLLEVYGCFYFDSLHFYIFIPFIFDIFLY